MIRIAAVIAGAAVLAGCALLSTPDPVQLYRFGGDSGAAPAAAPDAALASVSLRRIQFPDAVGDDRLLAVTGAEAAYIGGARWVSPAEELFTDALVNAFSTDSRRVRLIGRQELTPANMILDLDVRAFEARYDQGQEAAPTVRVSARARMLRFPERTVLAERLFTVDQPAGDNRVAAIVAAFDAATADLNGQLVAWTDEIAAQAPN